MRVSGIVRVAALALTLILTPILSGCGGNPFNPIRDPGEIGRIPPDTPLNDSVQNLMKRFETTYEFQDIGKYQLLLTADFRYTFSSQSDPLLVQTYGNNWGKIEEVESSKHLFEGFTNSEIPPVYVPAASKIDMTLVPMQQLADYTHSSDSTSFYQRIVVPNVQMTIDVPSGNGGDPTTYQIGDGARHEFYLVRGDVALLDAGQEARADRWYIYRWDDLSAAPPAAMMHLSSVDAAQVYMVRAGWGTIKGRYAR